MSHTWAITDRAVYNILHEGDTCMHAGKHQISTCQFWNSSFCGKQKLMFYFC